MIWRVNLVLVLSALLLTAVVACGASESPPAEPAATSSQSISTKEPTAAPAQTTSTKEPSAVPLQTDSSGSPNRQPNAAADIPSAYEGLLSSVPDTPENRGWVYIEDYALARQIFANDFYLPGPNDESIPQEWYDYLPPMTNDGQTPVLHFGRLSFFGWPQYLTEGDLGRHSNYLAFDVRHIDQTIAANDPAGIDVIQGRFDPDATDKALASCGECPPPDRKEHKGVSYYSWGGDNEKNEALKFSPPAFDRFGRGGRIAVLDDLVFRTLTTGDMETSINVHQDDGSSLADAEEFRFLAGGMSQLGAYTMLLSDKASGLEQVVEAILSDSYSGASKEEIDRIKGAVTGSAPLLRPYQAFAVGAGKDDAGPFMALALVHTDESEADDNAGLLRQRIENGIGAYYGSPWAELLDDAEISSGGRLVLAKTRGRMSMNPFDWVFNRDNLIVHE